MKRTITPRAKPLALALQTASCLVFALALGHASASEGYKLRQAPVGVFGGEIAALVDNPGLFATANATYTHIYKIADDAGNDVGVAARSIPLPTNSKAGLPIPDGSYRLNVPAGTIKFDQTQTQLNILAGYLTEDTYGDGRLAFAINIPLVTINRSFFASQPLGMVSPMAGAALPPQVLGAITTMANTANYTVQTGVIARNASENVSVTGLGDTELSAVWVRSENHLKVAAGVSLFVPTGAYDKNRGPNPGFGNFYTLRPGVALSYALNPKATDTAWDSGVTLAARLSYGTNTTNLDTDYRSGDFVYTELGVIKVTGNWAFGANLLAIQQVTDDSGTGVSSGANRYRNFAVGPFMSYKLPGKDAGFNVHVSRNFGSQNALVSESLQFRFIKAW